MAYAQAEQALAQIETSKVSVQQQFRVSITSTLTPIPINTIHNWVIYIENKDGEPVYNAEIGVDGGMLEHDHGLPTRPQVTRNSGEGHYFLEGIKFHMNGRWSVTISILDGTISDSVTFNLNL